MRGGIYSILFLFAVILVDTSSSDKERFSDKTYDDSLWTFSRNYRNENENEDDEIKHKAGQKKIDIKMPDVSPQKVKYWLYKTEVTVKRARVFINNES
jgi:hypothetical protein